MNRAGKASPCVAIAMVVCLLIQVSHVAGADKQRLRGSASVVEAAQATSLIEESRILAELAAEKEKLTSLLQQREREQAAARAADVVPEQSVEHGLGEASNVAPVVPEGVRHRDIDSDEQELEVEQTQQLRAKKVQEQRKKQQPAPIVASSKPALVIVEKADKAPTVPADSIMEQIPVVEPKASTPEPKPAKALSPEEAAGRAKYDASPSVHRLKAHIATLKAKMASADVEQAQAVALAAKEGVSLTKDVATPPEAEDLLEDGMQVHTEPEEPEQKLHEVEGSVPEIPGSDAKAKAKVTSAKAVPAPDSNVVAADAEEAVNSIKATIEDAEGGSEETEADAESFLVKYALWISVGTLLTGVCLTTIWCAAYNQEKRAPRGLPRKRGW